MSRMIRDLMAIFGALSLGWCVWSFHCRSDRAFTEGLIVSVVGLIVVMWAIHSDHRRGANYNTELDKVKLRNQYLEVAIKQLDD